MSKCLLVAILGIVLQAEHAGEGHILNGKRVSFPSRIKMKLLANTADA
jgi:hypothetical protein